MVCDGETYPAQIRYPELEETACERIAAAIVPCDGGEKRITAILDPHHPTGSTADVNFNTSSNKTLHRTSSVAAT